MAFSKHTSAQRWIKSEQKPAAIDHTRAKRFPESHGRIISNTNAGSRVRGDPPSLENANASRVRQPRRLHFVFRSLASGSRNLNMVSSDRLKTGVDEGTVILFEAARR